MGDAYNDAGATASDDVDGDITGDIDTVNPVDVDTVGSYSVTYNVSDSSSNAADEVTRTVNVVDTTLPEIAVLGDDPVTVEAGDAYDDNGATASDNVDGNISEIIVTASNVDADTPGSYSVTYNVTDSSNNDAVEATRTVNVVDSTAPVIVVPDDITVLAASLDGSEVNFVVDATDFVGVVSFVCSTESGDLFAIGDTVVTCDASDAATNASQATFTVTVELMSVGVEIQSGKLNLGKNGVLPVVIPGSADLDVTTISVSTLDLNGAGAAHGGHIDDVDGDGFEDLMVHFLVPELVIAPPPADGDEVTLTLTGELDDGTPFEGVDDVAVKIQRDNANVNSNKKGGKGK